MMKGNEELVCVVYVNMLTLQQLISKQLAFIMLGILSDILSASQSAARVQPHTHTVVVFACPLSPKHLFQSF